VTIARGQEWFLRWYLQAATCVVVALMTVK
jgi:hypothetical protein